MLSRDEDDFPACGVQPVESLPVSADLQRRTVPYPVVFDREPMAREGEIDGSHPLASVLHDILHLRDQPVEDQVHSEPRFGP